MPGTHPSAARRAFATKVLLLGASKCILRDASCVTLIASLKLRPAGAGRWLQPTGFGHAFLHDSLGRGSFRDREALVTDSVLGAKVWIACNDAVGETEAIISATFAKRKPTRPASPVRATGMSFSFAPHLPGVARYYGA